MQRRKKPNFYAAMISVSGFLIVRSRRWCCLHRGCPVQLSRLLLPFLGPPDWPTYSPRASSPHDLADDECRVLRQLQDWPRRPVYPSSVRLFMSAHGPRSPLPLLRLDATSQGYSLTSPHILTVDHTRFVIGDKSPSPTKQEWSAPKRNMILSLWALARSVCSCHCVCRDGATR